MIGLSARETVRRVFWRGGHRARWHYFLHTLPYQGMQIAWAHARVLWRTREGRDLRVERVRVPLAGWPAELDGYCFGQLSDMHAGPPFPLDYLEHAVKLALSLPVDAYVLTGDFINVWPEDAEPCARVLAPLAQRRPTWAILGNHDVWNDAHAVPRALERYGIRVLRNSGVPITRAGATFWLAGIDDARHGRPDLEAALSGAPAGVPVILLAHEPDYATEVAQDGRVALQLSGHTHGGQVVVPGYGPLFLPTMGKLYPPGLVRVGEMWLYTSRGVWASWPVRWNAPPEVSLIYLATGSSA